MSGSSRSMSFSEVSLGERFFDSVKEDYPEFDQWFAGKSAAGEVALVHRDEEGIGAFVYLKEENEAVEFEDGALPALPRLKIGTLKVADRVQGERLGEGAIGLALWRWRKLGHAQIFVTVFEKHASLVAMLEKFGFGNVGATQNGESVYVKDKRRLPKDSCKSPSFPHGKDDRDGVGCPLKRLGPGGPAQCFSLRAVLRAGHGVTPTGGGLAFLLRLRFPCATLVA